MDRRVVRALQVVVLLLVTAAIVGAGAFTYFALTFGSADHTEFIVTAEEMPRERIAANATASLSDRERAVVDAAHANGSARTAGERLDVEGAYVERNGTYYQVRVADGPDVTRERPVLRIERVDRTAPDAVAAEELPDRDRNAFLLAWKAWSVRQEGGRDGPQARYVYETVPDPDESVFAPTQEVRYVTRNNETFRVRVRNESVELDTTTYRLERVAANESAFVDELVVTVDGLNESAADPLERAIANGTYTSRAGRFEDAARPVRPLLRALEVGEPQAFMYERTEAVRYVRYEGSYYRVTVTGHTTAA
ncbi:hypothetical protein [Halorarius halobius]|uniref:hypothetical protein n=1 Tax=Halorarius halobius TaxID=2962671 RepID=UPI0020CFACD0|nr:hypothetical protein [Halorarius halobius]